MTEYGLIGKKLGHSFSAEYFNSRFGREHIDSRYYHFEIPDIEDMHEIIRKHPSLRGLNVTIPYKQEVIPYLDSMTRTAAEIGAVNTIRIERDMDNNIFLAGHNTDAVGFSEAIRNMLNGRRNALMLGLGGASKAVEYALRNLGVKVTKVSRRSAPGVLTYSDIDERVIAANDIIVNCTPLGMWPDTDACPDIPYDLIDSRYLCFDLIYNPEQTEFMRRAKSRGAEVSNGLKMLYGQAEAAYRFWNTRTFSIPDIKDSEEFRERAVMARHIDVISGETVNSYHLAIARLKTGSNGTVRSVSIEPFNQEVCNVEYFDSPLTIELMNKFPC